MNLVAVPCQPTKIFKPVKKAEGGADDDLRSHVYACLVACTGLLIVSGCIFSPVIPPEEGESPEGAQSGKGTETTEEIQLTFHLRVTVSERSNLSVQVTCRNAGQEPSNVQSFAVWGYNPTFSLEAPDGLSYEAVDARNLTIVPQMTLLQPGESMSRTYDLLAESGWTRSDGASLVSPLSVFSKLGQYRITAKYRPFRMDQDPAKQRITLISSANFTLPSGFWDC